MAAALRTFRHMAGLPPALTSSLQLVPKLLDVFVDAIEPLFTRLLPSSRWVAFVEGDAIAIHEVRKGVATFRAHLGATGILDAHDPKLIRVPPGSAVELRLPPDQILRRTLTLPHAGKDYLQPIIEHRLERLTPWSPEKVLYGFRVLDGPEADGSIAVAFAATSADTVAEPARRLGAVGLTPTVVGPAGEPLEVPLGIDLYRGTRSAARLRLRRSTAIALSTVAVLLAPACLASFWLARASEERLVAVEEQLAKVRARLPSGTGSKAEQARARDRALIEAKRPENAMVVLIDRLGSALPGNTFLRELEIDRAKVRLVGRSGNAPALIGLLEAKEALAKVQFTAPVTRDSENRDEFEIVATRIAPKAPEDK